MSQPSTLTEDDLVVLADSTVPRRYRSPRTLAEWCEWEEWLLGPFNPAAALYPDGSAA